MKKQYQKFALVMALCLIIPGISLAFGPSAEKVFSGTITKINGSQFVFKTTSAATYNAETGSAVLARKNGATMKFDEVLIGDKLEVKGRLWPDNSISASYIRNMSLYVHNGTFNGKITAIDPSNLNFTMQSKQYGTQTIRTNELTNYKKNSKNSTFRDLELGYTAKVKGIWDRTNSNVLAKDVQTTARLVNISVTGRLAMKNLYALTIEGDNHVIYGVDANKAKLVDKNGKTISLGLFNIGDTLKVEGKHVSENVQVIATKIKDESVIK